MKNLLATAALSALTHSAVTSAAPAQNCPATDVCYSVGVPSSSASSGSGNIYIQLRAPTSYAWVGIGQGSQMAGANMFLIYADGAGNVTVSPRSGLGHVEPQENADADVEVLAGTGVESGAMVANFRCGSCGGAEMDLASTSAGWIAAWEQGDAIDSLDRNAQIVKHDSYDISQIDLTQATITSDSNPYVTSGDGGSNGSGSGSGSSGDSGNTSGGSGDSGDSSSGGGTVTTPGAVIPGGAGDTASFAKIGKIIMAHWVVMLVVWVILFPLGSALMPLFGKWVLHAAWQSVAFILMWAGFGLGYVASQQIGLGFQTTHTTFGTVLVCLMALQPIGGWLHHRHHLQHGGRGAVSHVHIWYGRALMIMGVVNGGLGIRLVNNGDAGGRPLTIGYSVAAAVVAVIYIAAKGFGVLRTRRLGGRNRGGGVVNGSGSDADGQPAKVESNNGNGYSHSSGSPRRPYP
ncbi:hypothetical protein MGN70_014583 [Eutypa lata]|nr:hypothetical protein MGN70_014583 [Eutypa lata]